MRAVAALILGSCLPCAPLLAGEPRTSTNWSAFEDRATEWMAKYAIPGLSAAYLKDGSVHATAVGWSDVENRVAATPDTSYRGGSMSKVFTALGIVRLSEAGKIDLDGEIQQYVPSYPRKRWPVTVRGLLAHLSGVGGTKPEEKQQRFAHHASIDSALAIFANRPLEHEPGTSFIYSSYGYNLLGSAIEHVTKQSFSDFVKSTFVKPLGLTGTCIDGEPLDGVIQARAYVSLTGEIETAEALDLSSRIPSGGMRTSVTDLMKLAQALFDARIISTDAFESMLRETTLADGSATGWGMLWRVFERSGRRVAFHGGTIDGGVTYFAVFPDERAAFAFQFNTLAPLVLGEGRRLRVRDLLAEPLYEIVLGEATAEP